jgi:hypothetical protein
VALTRWLATITKLGHWVDSGEGLGSLHAGSDVWNLAYTKPRYQASKALAVEEFVRSQATLEGRQNLNRMFAM